MRKGILIGLGWIFGICFIFGVAWGKDGSVKILIPIDKAVITESTFIVKFKFEKEGKGDHVHVFLDGRLYDVIDDGDSFEIDDPGVGTHSIMVQVFTKEHLPLPPYDLIRVKVK